MRRPKFLLDAQPGQNLFDVAHDAAVYRIEGPVRVEGFLFNGHVVRAAALTADEDGTDVDELANALVARYNELVEAARGAGG